MTFLVSWNLAIVSCLKINNSNRRTRVNEKLLFSDGQRQDADHSCASSVEFLVLFNFVIRINFKTPVSALCLLSALLSRYCLSRSGV